MVSQFYDVIIVGAGPAGLRCAEILAENKKKVLILEKNKTIGNKVCAGGITRKVLELGVPKSIIHKEFKKILIHTPLQNTEIKSPKTIIATIKREDLGNWQAKKAKKAGAEIRTESEVTKIDKKEITINNNEPIKFKYLVGAGGANSIVRKYLQLETNKFEQGFHYITKKKFKDLEIFVDPKKYGPYYLWIFPYKNTTSVGTGVDLTKKKKNPILGLNTSEIKGNLEKFCKKRFDIKKAKFQACTISYDYQGHEFGNIFLIGEAAGLVSGFTGEGICWAIQSGEDVARKIINKKHKQEKIQHILKIKEVEDGFMETLEINKTLTEIELETIILLLKNKWFAEKLIDGID